MVHGVDVALMNPGIVSKLVGTYLPSMVHDERTGTRPSGGEARDEEAKRKGKSAVRNSIRKRG